MTRGLGWIAALSALVALSACAQRGAIAILPQAAEVGAVEEIHIVSSRQEAPPPELFSPRPAPALGYARATVSVPPERDVGTVTFPQGSRPDPATDFLTVGADRFADEAAFLQALNRAIGSTPDGNREVTVFVHGFNTNFAEGLYRHAQLRHDLQAPGVSVSYAWPSAGNALAYARDRESALVARDGLEDLLRLLGRSRAERALLVGHSMGAFLLMETVRQAAIRDDRAALARVHAVVLIAPDIDVEVFRRQARALSDAGIPIYLFTSSRDRALRFSSILRGSSERLGSVSDPGQLSDLPVPVTVIDLSQVDAENDALNHFVVASSPAMLSLFQGLGTYGLDVFGDPDGTQGLFETSVTVVQDVTQVILQPVATR